MIILALDLASNAGWCCGPIGGTPRLDSVELAPGGSVGARGCALVDWLADHIQVFQPGLVAFESPLPRGKHSGIQAGRIALGLAMACEMFCHRRNLACREAAVTEARKVVLGKGNAQKDEAMRACRAAGLNPRDTDAADAWVLWRFACVTRGRIGGIA
jgi:Holliday junction resolvasome RuvABC endonuclease subunit